MLARESSDNLTPFALGACFQYDVDDVQKLVVCVAGRFLLPPPGRAQTEPLAIHEEQLPPPLVDVHWGDPARTSARYAGQGSVRRNGAEVYLQGSAWAVRGKATAVPTRVRVGPCSKSVEVIGDRVWKRGLLGLVPSSPAPFKQMSLRYERAFGGSVYADDGRLVAQDARNPVGRGFYIHEQAAAEQPLPNLRIPGEQTTEWNAPGTPCGYGPIAPGWQPRLGFAGAYDSKWMAERLPLWPRDLDPRFFSAAAQGLTMSAPLRGGESVVLEGFSPDGIFSFLLPTYRLVAKSEYPDRTVRGLLALDGVMFEPDEGVVTVYWRRAVPLGHGPKAHLHTVVRPLETWEAAPS
ncbi:DUF2169 family type VI secretion system accessory protein [Pyxidicoccus xibeiensis]|uniref:DUF2169 family type VI secretion system accessory protein n=1 Tax=Pyxidicoccus xibeiensis TaxID=2906759 RepID=UPI0020A7C52D|nr:DUF2169 domain-containing protein [Pyxidicoccus xibeiensis]MCP3143644.1 DUF2169 domain-containing protein [Pyxidicoccus xibeiensis]